MNLLKEGFFYKKYGDKLQCNLCPHNCVLDNGQKGICSVRVNEDNILKTINYGEITAMAMDPIEKKPLYHFYPGSNILSVGSFGCNLSCSFCQNYSIAHYRVKSKYMTVKNLIDNILEHKNNIGIAFTYNEPTISYEYIYEVSKEVKSTNPDMKVVLITNGYMEIESLRRLLPYIDAMNIDLKSFQKDYYKKVCGGNLNPVLKVIEEVSGYCHLEITTLLVNGLNDSKDEVEKIASFISNLDKNIPLHLSRYFPTYKMNRPPTKIDVMMKNRNIAKKFLNYVYLGNISGVDNSTYCPKCGELIIKRNYYSSKTYIIDNKCPSCNNDIKIVI